MASEENTQGQGPPRQRKGKKLAPRSTVYQHFTQNNNQKTWWSCKYCGEVVGADTNKHGTTNLWKHHRKCKGRGGESVTSNELVAAEAAAAVTAAASLRPRW